MFIQDSIPTEDQSTTLQVHGDSIRPQSAIDTVQVEHGYMVVDNETGMTTITLQGQKKSYKNEIVISGLLFLILAMLFWYHHRRRKKSKVRPLASENARSIEAKLDHFMKDQKVYRDPNLGLKELATHLNISEKRLSIFLNANKKTTFYDYINGFRLKDFTETLETKGLQNYSIMGLAQNSGFKSKSVFYREFRKKFNSSPSDYMKKMNN